jgi:hypothetical protein
MDWKQKLMEFVQAARPLSDREAVELASEKFKSMLCDIDVVQARLEELRDSLKGALEDAEKVKALQ